MNTLVAFSKLILPVFIVLAFNTLAMAQEQTEQEMDLLRKRIATLEQEIKIKSDSLFSAKERLKLLEQTKFLALQSSNNDNSTILTTIKSNGVARESAHPMSKDLFNVVAGDTVQLSDYFNGYWLISNGELYGHTNEMFVNENAEVLRFKRVFEERNAEYKRKKQLEYEFKDKALLDSQKLEREKKRAELEKELTALFGNKIAVQILDGLVWIGMTTDMAKLSWGRPLTINSTIGSWGVREQWVYGGGEYLYFDNGKLTTWQTSR
jgi:hypothetical protein